MAHAYTPGLKVAARTTVRNRRVLPLEGRVLVGPGERVQATTPVAEADLPGRVHPVNVANRLGVPPADVRSYMLKQKGDAVERDEPIAETRPWLRWLKTVCRAPVAGTIETVSDLTGQVMLREPPQKVTISAYIDGAVAEVLPREGAVVQTEAALVQGIFGVGGERNGRIIMLARSPGESVEAASLDSACQNCIIVVGSPVTAALVEAARERGAAALVGGGMHAEELRRVLGYEIGVAVTGSEQIGPTVVLTEGFGRVAMAQRTFELLRSLDGMQASVSGATQIRAGVVRPEIIVPLGGRASGERGGEPGPEADGMREGDPVRIIRAPHFGLIGKVEQLVPELQRIETEAVVRVLRVRLEHGRMLTVPRANVEVIKA